jgi:ParB/Sulfiredoxin domain
MKLIELELSDLVVSEELSRSGSAKQFEERLKSSIEEIGLAEPIKVAPLPTGRYVVVDGTMRLKAIATLRKADPNAFTTIPAYVMDYDRRYELRYQTDIYQDLLPSQLAGLVEHLHKTEHVRKADIARYIGVSPATLRNYTGLWRLLQRGGLFAKIVELMDVEVIPCSNPYAWLRLTATGLRYVLEHHFSAGERAESWIEQLVLDARRGKTVRFPIKIVEAATDALPPEYYREGEELRTVKRDLGLRRAGQSKPMTMPSDDGALFDVSPEATPVAASVRNGSTGASDAASIGSETTGARRDSTAVSSDALRYLSRVSRRSPDPVLRSAARSLKAYLQ